MSANVKREEESHSGKPGLSQWVEPWKLSCEHLRAQWSNQGNAEKIKSCMNVNNCMNKTDGNEKWGNHVNECNRLVRGIWALAHACVEKGSVDSEEF